jgi:hypothetical protein
MKKLAFLLLLLPAIVGAQTLTNVSGIITDATGQTWNNGSITFTFNQNGTFPPYFNDGVPYTPAVIRTNLDSGGGFSGLMVPSNSHIVPVGTAWNIQVCPQSNSNCYVLTSPITIQGTTMDISGVVVPPPIVVSPIPGAAAYQDSEVNGVKFGSLYYRLTTSTYRVCTGLNLSGQCNLWVDLGGGGGGGAVKWNDLLNPNGNLSPNFGGATFDFHSGTWNFADFNFIVPQSTTFVPTSVSTIGINTTFNNFRVWNGVEASDLVLAPMGNTYNNGDVFGISNVAGHLTAVDIPVNPSSGPGILNVTITNPTVNDSFCISSISPVTVVNCTEGVPVTQISATSYTIDCIADRGAYLLFTAATLISVSLPQASSGTACDANFFTYIRPLNARLTVTPVTSTIDDGGGAAASATWSPGYGGNIFSDDTNYFAKIGPFREGSNPLLETDGYDVGPTGRFQWQEPNATPATVLFKMVCPNGSGGAIICPFATASTNKPDGVAANGVASAPGSTGNVSVCSFGYCTVFFDNTATGNHYAQQSTTTDGMLHDVGTTPPTNGQPFWHITSANSGPSTTGIIRILTSDELNASGVGATKIQVNGSTNQPVTNLRDTGCTTFLTSNSGNTTNVDTHVCHGISFEIGDPGGTALTVASTTTAYIRIPFACTIQDYSLLLQPSGTITVKFWKIATGTTAPTSANSINTSGVGISSGTAIRSTTLSDFTTTSVAANDFMAMNVTAVATASYVNGVLNCKE